MNSKSVERLVDQETQASEASRDQPLSGRAARKGETRSVVYSVRLTPEQTKQIQQLADDAGVPASGLVRDWVLQGLAAEREGSAVDAVVKALSVNVDRLRRTLAKADAHRPT